MTYSRNELVDRLAFSVGNAPAGVQAALRRAPLQEPPPPEFFLLSAAMLDAAGLPEGGRQREREEQVLFLACWATALAGLEQPDKKQFGLVRKKPALGRALAEANYPELRLLKLLNAGDAQVWGEAALAVRFLESKGQPFALRQLVDLVAHGNGPQRSKVRQSIARGYYSARHSQKETTE